MAKTIEEIKNFPLAHSEKGVISIYKLTEPYGPSSQPIVSIGISLSGDKANPDYKAHIPLDNINDLIDALKSI